MKKFLFFLLLLLMASGIWGCRKEKTVEKIDLGNVKKEKSIVLAGGCFWGVEGYFRRLPGVLDTEVGYANGRTENPSYEEVCRNNTGHAEAVKILYDVNRISLEELLLHYLRIIDPYSLNRQGNDVGTQYRTGVYYEKDPSEIQRVFQKFLERERAKGVNRPFRVEVLPLENFYSAEEYHQDYLEKNPMGYCHVNLAMASEPLFPGKKDKDFSSEEKKLSQEAYHVLRENGTELPGSSLLDQNFRPGIYVDVLSGEPLFASSEKFDARCGWPSFSKPIESGAVTYREDTSHGMRRIEVRSRTSDVHLGHVFPDGPKEEGGLRYCINGVSLRFIPYEDMEDEGYGELKDFVDFPRKD